MQLYKRFEPWIGNNETSRLHMKEAIFRSPPLRKLGLLLISRYDMTVDEIINETWRWIREHSNRKACKEHLQYYSRNLEIDEEIVGNFARQSAKSVVLFFMKEECRRRTRETENFIKYSEELLLTDPLSKPSSPFEEIDERNDKIDLITLLDRAVITDDDSSLLLWKLEIVSDEYLMLKLGVSRRTLFSRWHKLQARLKDIYNSPIAMVPQKRNVAVTTSDVLEYLNTKITFDGTRFVESGAQE